MDTKSGSGTRALYIDKTEYDWWPVNEQDFILLYSWRFSRYSAYFHWLVHGHMTSNNETVSRQMPWAGNIAKAMTSNGKQFTVTRSTVHCWLLLHVMAGISARFSNFVFVFSALSQITLWLVPWGTVNFVSLESQCFPRLRLVKHWDSRKTKFIVPSGIVIKC